MVPKSSEEHLARRTRWLRQSDVAVCRDIGFPLGIVFLFEKVECDDALAVHTRHAEEFPEFELGLGWCGGPEDWVSWRLVGEAAALQEIAVDGFQCDGAGDAY